ncbi:hypothetical protein BDP27DRAFT_1418516 [Rhodocollybia butyracea]|uniref:Uncharacterized protein n=1 Tax=Rhodocollybia butyracea TaxID=206335 RepID=A0A9P5PTA4_9AGAR|nr:hypothetical protein BDP27DRAFT_1418516 [Rhodocollybia butyracea]
MQTFRVPSAPPVANSGGEIHRCVPGGGTMADLSDLELNLNDGETHPGDNDSDVSEALGTCMISAMIFRQRANYSISNPAPSSPPETEPVPLPIPTTDIITHRCL